jgi:hypothetical protein
MTVMETTQPAPRVNAKRQLQFSGQGLRNYNIALLGKADQSQVKGLIQVGCQKQSVKGIEALQKSRR